MTTGTIAPTMMRATKLLGLISEAWLGGKRRVWLEGGTWSSKTYSVMQFIKLIAEKNPESLLISVVSETMPHLKRGAIRDFLAIMGDDLVDAWWNRSDFIYRFANGSIVEFFSADMPAKLRGGRRDILFINEANNISYDSFRELDMRTRLFSLADWNPVSEFWFHDNKLGGTEDSLYIHSTYSDAMEVIPQNVVEDIESYQDKDPNWWRVYGLGLIGKIEGLVYPNFEQVDELPEGQVFYGLDYGFSSDPTVLVKNVIIGDKLYSKEMFYIFAPMTNEEIAREMSLCKVGNEPVWADRNELKSAEELRRLGYNVDAVDKAYYGVSYRIKQVNTYYQHWTTDSLNCIKEQRNYRFLEDKNHLGTFTDKTTHRWSHGMTAREFGVVMHKPLYTGAEPPATNYM